MQTITIGLDLAKNVFQAHGVGTNGEVMFRRKLRRSEVIEFFQNLAPCLVGMEACASAHHWARELSGLGHSVRLMPAAYVKPYAKRGKSDAIDAEAICEAVTRPTMRFVEIKSMDQQAVIMLHRTRDLLIRQRTMLANALRGHLAEFGIVAPKGVWRLSDLVVTATSAPVCRLPDLARECVELIVTQVEELERHGGSIHSGMAPKERGLQTARDDTGNWRDHRVRHRCRRHERGHVQIGPSVRGLDRTDTTTDRDGWQSTFGPHHESRRSQPASSAGPRRDQPRALRAPKAGAGAVDQWVAGAASRPGGDGRDRE
jgi:hypothetical protein